MLMYLGLVSSYILCGALGMIFVGLCERHHKIPRDDGWIVFALGPLGLFIAMNIFLIGFLKFIIGRKYKLLEKLVDYGAGL